MKRKPSPSSEGRKYKGYQVWHFALAVPAIAVTLQLMLGSLTPLPKEHNPYNSRYNNRYVSNGQDRFDGFRHHPYQNRQPRMPEVEILPLNLRGEMTGPILASVIKDYFPESTATQTIEQAIDLRDTMPPSDNPRMIVILPKDDEPVF